MNIALVCERIDPWRGGAETSTLQFARHLAARGCRVTLVTTSYTQLPPPLALHTIRVAPLLRARRALVFAERADAFVRDNRFDVVHAISPLPSADVYEPRGGALPEVVRRNVAIRRTPWHRQLKHAAMLASPKTHVQRTLERALVRRTRPPVIIAVSRYVADQFREHYGLDAPTVRVVFNGVDPDTAPPPQRAADESEIRRQYELGRYERLILTVAHNFRLKGVARLIEAVAALATPQRQSMRFVIVGRDNPTPFVRLARRLGVADRLLWAGATERVTAFYHAADVLVHPTYYDPCSRVVLEALSAGVPVITTRLNGAAEVMTDEREGFILDTPDDVPALADRLTRLLDDAFREQCAAAARETGRSVGMDRHAGALVAIYRELCGNR
jgi:UDP-glucose:(heptosyl)LPS alpha-1,3-glucosyltransferase